MHVCTIIIYNHVFLILYACLYYYYIQSCIVDTLCSLVLLSSIVGVLYVYYFMLSLSRVTILLDDTAAISPSAFAISIWNTLYRSPSLRQPAAEYMLGHLIKGKSEVCQTLKRIDECQDVMVITMFMEFPCSLFQPKIHV